jgi:hypothetical protein
LNLKDKKNRVIPLDSIWGFRRINENSVKNVVRLQGKGVGEGSYILAYDENMVIYREYHYYGFSKTLDSEVFPLSLENLKLCYKDNKAFMDLLERDPIINSFKSRGITAADKNRNLRIMSLYRRSLSEIHEHQ